MLITPSLTVVIEFVADCEINLVHVFFQTK